MWPLVHTGRGVRIMENGRQISFWKEMLRLPGLCFSRTSFLYHVISGRGTPRASHSNFRVLLLFTAWFVKFWVSQGRFRAADQHTSINAAAVILLGGLAGVWPRNNNIQSWILSVAPLICACKRSGPVKPTINSEDGILDFNPPVESLSKALVTSGAVWGHIMQVERTRNGMFSELELGRVGGDGPVEGVQPLERGVEVASCLAGQGDVIVLDGWRGLDGNLLGVF